MRSFLLLTILLACVFPSFAQTADVRYAGVFYQDSPTNIHEMYCDYSPEYASFHSSNSQNGDGGTSGIPSNYSFLNDHFTEPGGDATTKLCNINLRYVDRVSSTSSGPSGYSKFIAGGTTYVNGKKVYFQYNGYDYKFTVNDSSCTTDEPCASRSETVDYPECSATFSIVNNYAFRSFKNPGNTSAVYIWDYLPGFFDGQLIVQYDQYVGGSTGSGTYTCESQNIPVREPDHAYQVGDVYGINDSFGFCQKFKVTGYVSQFPFNVTAVGDGNRSFVTSPAPNGNSNQTDPWVSSALIEYDQPYPSTEVNNEAHVYPNHCLGLCMSAYCDNKPLGGSTYSISFPLQNIRFDIVKYYNNKNIENAEETPPIRTIDLYPNTEATRCASYHCGGASVGNPCSSATKVCNGEICEKWCTNIVQTGCTSEKLGQCIEWNEETICFSIEDGVQPDAAYVTDHTDPRWLADHEEHYCGAAGATCWSVQYSNCGNYGENCMVYNFDGQQTGRPTPFCAAWDGSYEINGEFGKTNGQFAYRSNLSTDSPGDGVMVDKIQFDSMIAYPGMNQIPIQVDVTNVHMVRSTPSVVGTITPVAAQPYTYSYRLSKDADMRIAILDASNRDAAAYALDNTSTPIGDSGTGAGDLIVRTLTDWEPRLGEGMRGREGEVQITEFDSWDGRNDQGMFLPAGNYVVTLQAKSADEWPGIDFSRAVTRQMSLDPLKLTDVVARGLNRQSTAYATISYVPTESSKVFWYIYSPGTVFDGASTIGDVLTDSSKPTATPPTPMANTGSLVAKIESDRQGRLNFTSRWDGLCGMNPSANNGLGEKFRIAKNKYFPLGALSSNGGSIEGTQCVTADGCDYYLKNCKRKYPLNATMSDGRICTTTGGCTQTFAYGSPMPDGNYVYALWAEIPYNGKYVNAVGAADHKPLFTSGASCSGTDLEINGQCFTGVKTLKYNVGEVAIERGLVDITIQPVSYSTVGSSPTAYGLDPFIFKYSIARDATVIAKVENTAGAVVKYLTPINGVSQVAQQMNTISWDGRDDAGRMVTPGTYMFVVETADAMFPAVTNRASAIFPVDMYRVVDLATTDVYGDSDAKATISYALSKAMNVQVNIYNKDVVIPALDVVPPPEEARGRCHLPHIPASAPGYDLTFANGDTVSCTASEVGETITYNTEALLPYRQIVTVSGNDMSGYDVIARREYLSSWSWPPRICDQTTDAANFDGGHINPSTQPLCIYVNDTTFTNYPADADTAASNEVDVRLQPIKTFERSAMQPGDGLRLTEEWDALYFYNPTPAADRHTTEELDACRNATDITACPYEMVPDGQYPFFIAARSNEPFDRYYYTSTDGTMEDPVTEQNYLEGAPFRTTEEAKQEPFLYATDKVTSKINVTRGPVFFLDGSTVVYPNAPQLFNVSSGPVFVPPYEINFSVSRASTVEVAVVALQSGVCTPDPTVHQPLFNNRAGDVCKYLSTQTITNTGHFDPNVVRKAYWDGTDNNGYYVKPGIYEIRLTAKNYPDPGLYQPTVKSITLNADILKVFDLLEADGYAISQRGTNMNISYQLSVPMKVGIQIFKPGTTIYDYEKGTLRNPSTGTEVKDIREVLVKAITGIRPATTLIEEVWDGKDYAGQEVPDGTYPFRFVTATISQNIDSVTGEIKPGDDASTERADWKINYVADTYEYQNLHKATIAIGDGQFVCEDWEKTVFFYPNPLTDASKGTLEITKMPVPGEVSIKYFNLAGDLVREGDYTCVDANNYTITMGDSLSFNPDNDPDGSQPMTAAELAAFPNIRNAALRCRWDRTNQHGKRVARGVYFGLVDFKAKMGREHCQKVVKILIP